MLIRLLSVDEVMWCRQQSVNHQELLCSLHCATTVVLREQLNFKSAVIRSERSSCYMLVNMCVDGDYDVPSPDLKSFLICIDSHHSFFFRFVDLTCLTTVTNWTRHRSIAAKMLSPLQSSFLM